MILPVTNISKNSFTAKKIDEDELKSHPIVLENNLLTRMNIGWDKFTNALTMYPARGLKGSKNSNFYEFLTMGMIPNLTGSLMLMAVFNSANKYFTAPSQRAGANKFGRKMALGVVFYALAKSISKNFVTRPVKWITGVDTEEPYIELKYMLPEYKSDANITSLEYHKVLESLEFPRWEVKYGDESQGEPRNVWFDKIARKIGLGSNLKDSDQDVKPRVKEIAVKTNLAKTFSSYMWAAVGVAMAVQNTWDEFFNMATWKFWHGKDFLKTIGKFLDSTCNSLIELCKGPEDAVHYGGLKGFFGRHNGKLLLGLAATSTIVGLINVLISRQKPSKVDSADVIDQDRKFVVN